MLKYVYWHIIIYFVPNLFSKILLLYFFLCIFAQHSGTVICNPNFKVVEFDHFRMQANLPSMHRGTVPVCTFLGVWERIYNPNFNYGEFATIRNQSGLNSFKRCRCWRIMKEENY